jgi:hypothetical protein
MPVQFGIIDHIDRQQIPIYPTFDEPLEQVRRFDADGFLRLSPDRTSFHGPRHGALADHLSGVGGANYQTGSSRRLCL